jgi:hypothetical protein
VKLLRFALADLAQDQPVATLADNPEPFCRTMIDDAQPARLERPSS